MTENDALFARNEIVPILNKEQNSILNWAVLNNLSLNFETTEMVIVSNIKKPTQTIK